MKLEELEVYKIAMSSSNDIWEIYLQLPKQFKFNIGDQVLRSVDSIGANVAEGFDRYHYKDSVKFYYNARGSLFESKHWLKLLHTRELIDFEKYNTLKDKLNLLGIKLNNFINSIKRQYLNNNKLLQ